MRYLVKVLAACCCLLLAYGRALAIDPPHGDSGCGSCHATELLSSPFWGEANATKLNNLCLLNCHNASSAPYTATSSPSVKTHSSANTSDTYGEWIVRCVDCHDPHYHQQKTWQKSESAKLYLATGQLTGFTYDAGSNVSTLTYSSMNYKAGWSAAALIAKSSAARSAIVFPNVKKTGFSFAVVAVDSPANTIKVEGDVSPLYVYTAFPTNFGVIYGQYIRMSIDVNGTKKPVKFFGKTGPKSFADGDATQDGICEVCHTQTAHWSPAAPNGDSHYPGQDCTTCHSHKVGFGHGGDGSGATCAACHTSGGHSAHLAMNLACSACHNVAAMRDGNGNIIDPRTTGVCAVCHHNGRNGAPNHNDYAANWSNPGYNLSCDGCHSGRPLLDTLVMAFDGHNKLVGVSGVRRYPCYYCHDESVNAASAMLSKHCNGAIDVAIAGQWSIQDQDPPAIPSYDPNTKVCDNVYCHTDGTSTNPEMRPYPWSGGVQSCNSCHGHDPSESNCADCHGDGRAWAANQEWLSSMPMYANTGPGTARANSHYRHLFTGFSCDDCHFSTVAGGGCLSCHTDANGNPVIPAGDMGETAHVNGAFHVNKVKNVVFKDGGSYDSGSKTCSNTACHTGGTDPVWGGSVNSAITCLECHGSAAVEVDDFGEFNDIQARISLAEWDDTGHGRPTASGDYDSGNPPANFPTNGCWYCHDNEVLHKTDSNPYRLRKHTHFENRFAKECVYCHMEEDAQNPGRLAESQCLSCHDDAGGETMAPQLVNTAAQGQVNPPYLISRPNHAPYSGGGVVCATCHPDDARRHKTGSDIVWTTSQKADVKNQYVMMGVCLICHDDDSGGQCTTCHAAPADNPATPNVDESLRYALGFDPGIEGLPRIDGAASKASSVHFGYKHYAAYQSNGVWKGGKFCWDCHDPHGDGNIYMIQNQVATATDGTHGQPTSRNEVVFTRKQNGNDYAKSSAPYNGICNVCHTNAGMHYQDDYGDAHNSGRLCVNCHQHRFTDSHAGTADCNTCHENKPVPRHTAFGLPRDCTKCHQGAVGKRMDVMGQFVANSHHVQGTTVTGRHCYACHWEATELGLIDPDYHVGYNPSTHASTKDAEVDLVIWGPGVRPTIYDLDGSQTGTATASRFLASDISSVTLSVQRAAVDKVTPHCLGCHSDQNNDTAPFSGDCRPPRQYAWDRSSVASRYSDASTTTWGKYTGTANAAPKNVTKAFSAHGNAVGNAGGYSATTGLDSTITNTRAGGYNVQCFDCHSSHGSKAVGTTSSYKTFNGTNNGGNLKETQAGKGGYAMTYTASANGNPSSVNPYKTGAGQCFDCHETANAGTTPWGYSSTFGAAQPILGYTDTPRFGQGSRGQGTRYTYKSSTVKGGHFKASSALGSSPMSTINGLCTPCHDPHGISPALGNDRQYAVPLLKGTWLTSPYKEDAATSGATTGKRGAQGMNPSPTPTPTVYLDQNTFVASTISEDDQRFAGLCLGCHAKASLTDGTNNNGTWKSVDRIHESVKGWGDNQKHNYSCSKCHLPHSSTLPRLMATNCLNTNHRGRVASGGVPGDNQSVWRYNSCVTVLKSWPGSFPSGKSTAQGNTSKFKVNCHPTGTWPDNSWNVKTPW